MPLTEQQIKALKTDAIVNLGKTELFDKDISIIIKVLTGSEKIAKLTLPGNQLYKDYQLLINAILQHSTLLEVDFANPAVLADSKLLSQNRPTAMFERILLVCLAYKNEIYRRIVKAKEKLEKLRTELSKDMPPSAIIATLALTVKNIHKEIEKIQRFEYFMKFFSEKFNTDNSKFFYKFPLPEQNNLFNQIKNFSEVNINDRNSLKKVFLDKLKKHSSEIIELNLSGWDFTDKDFSDLLKMFFSFLSSTKKLKRFTLTHFIFSQSAADFVFSMVGKYTLESVDISNNSNFDLYQEKFFSIIAHSKSVITLDVRNTLSVPATKTLLNALIQFRSSVKVVELTRDREDSEQQLLLKQYKKSGKTSASSKRDFSGSIKYFTVIISSLNLSRKGETLVDLQNKFIRFQKQPNLVDEKKLYMGIMDFIISLDKPEPDLLTSHLIAFSECPLRAPDGQFPLDEKISYLKFARMYLEQIFLKSKFSGNFCDEIGPLALEIHKKYLLLYIKKNVKTFTLSKRDIGLIKSYIESAQAIDSLQENLNHLNMIAEAAAKVDSNLPQNTIFNEIALAHSELKFFKKEDMSSAEDKTSISYTFRQFIWGKLSSSLRRFESSVIKKVEIPDDKSPAP